MELNKSAGGVAGHFLDIIFNSTQKLSRTTGLSRVVVWPHRPHLDSGQYKRLKVSQLAQLWQLLEYYEWFTGQQLDDTL
jgi:hypothetical protein